MNPCTCLFPQLFNTDSWPAKEEFQSLEEPHLYLNAVLLSTKSVTVLCRGLHKQEQVLLLHQLESKGPGLFSEQQTVLSMKPTQRTCFIVLAHTYSSRVRHHEACLFSHLACLLPLAPYPTNSLNLKDHLSFIKLIQLLLLGRQGRVPLNLNTSNL